MKRPFEGNYAVSLFTAIISLVPFIVVTAAYALYREQVARDIGATATSLQVINGLATAGYAFGALAGGDLINRFKQRSLFLCCESLFILACLLCASAGHVAAYGSGRVLQGLATGVLLVVALPPVIRRFPASRMPITAAAINLGFFGAITVGPLFGGVIAHVHAWRLFYGALGGVGILTLVLAFLTLPGQEPQNPRMRFDVLGIGLGLGATVLPFWAVGELSDVGFTSTCFLVPFCAGLACFVGLLLVEYHQQEPLAPVKQMWHTFPIIGTLTAMVGGGAFMTFLTLAEQFLHHVNHSSALVTGLAFWPQVVGALIGACLLGLLLRTRFLPILILAGMLLLLGGGGMLSGLRPQPGVPALLYAAAGLLGLGAGATVSPGLYLAAFSLPSKIVGRTFALVELVRSVADFIVAPVVLQIARLASGSAQLTLGGIRDALWVSWALSLVLLIFGVVLYLSGARSLPRPDIEAWITTDRPAIGSPLLAAKVRGDGKAANSP